MSHAPTAMREMLRGALRRGAVLVGVFALLVAAVSAVPASKALGLFDAHHVMAVTDCQDGAGGGCDSHGAGQVCSFHGGCVSIGVLAAAPAVAAAVCEDWAAVARASVAGWAGFPAKPPPISLS